MCEGRQRSCGLRCVPFAALSTAALLPCSNTDAAPITNVTAQEAPRVTLTFDRDQYSSDATMHVTLRLETVQTSRWWARFPVAPAFEPCNSNILIHRTDSPKGPIVYDRSRDAAAQSCGLFDGGPAAGHAMVSVPPPFEVRARIPLVANTGTTAAGRLVPGVYLVEGLLYLGRVGHEPEDTQLDITPLRASRAFRVTE